MLKLLAFAFLAVSVNGNFWRSCNLANVVTPDHIVSPVCAPGAARCQVSRGQAVDADAFFTPVHAHNRLDATATAHHLLLVGGSLNVSLIKVTMNVTNLQQN